MSHAVFYRFNKPDTGPYVKFQVRKNMFNFTSNAMHVRLKTSRPIEASIWAFCLWQCKSIFS